MDRPIASDLSQQVLQMRRLRGELGPCQLDSTNRTLYALPCVVVQREAFIADRQTVLDGFKWEGHVHDFDPTLGHYRGRKGRG